MQVLNIVYIACLYSTQLDHVRWRIHGLSSAEGFKRENPLKNHPFLTRE